MKYSDKVAAKTHPCKYDVDTRYHQEGAWRHWRRHMDREGRLSPWGKRLVENDREFLARRFRAKAQDFVV